MSVWLKNNRLSLLFLFVITLLTYGNSLNNAFLSDDIAEIVNNPNIGNLNYAITSHPFGFIRLILYWVAFHIGSLNPIYFRLINVIFHVGSVFVIFIILNKSFSKKLAILVATLFAIHPSISEAVVWISGGSYPQYSFFFLLSLFFYLSSNEKIKYLWISVLFFLFSFMSHPQMPLALFVIFPLWELCFGNLKKNWKKTIPFVGITIIYILIVLSALPERETTLQAVHYQEGGIDNPFVLIPIAITSYLELTFLPKALTIYHSELAFGTINFAVRILLTILLIFGILISFKKNKFIFFWGSFFLISLSPTLTPFRLNWIVAERYLYLPILGIFTLIGLGLDKLTKIQKYKQAVYTVFAVVIILLSARTILRNIDWKNQDNLWLSAAKTSPSSPNNHNNLGDLYGRQGDKAAALKEFQIAIVLKPNYGDAYHNLANTYGEIGEYEKALENYQNAIKYNPNLWQSYQNIAAIHFTKARQATISAETAQNEYNLTVENFQKAIQINPKNINLVNNLGIVYLLSGNKDKAKEIFNFILSSNPNNQTALAGLAESNK